MTAAERARERERQRILAMPDYRGRARVDNSANPTRYTIAPTSDVATGAGPSGQAGGNSSVMKRIMSQYASRQGGSARKR